MGTPTPGPGKFSQRTDKAVSEANRDLPNAGYGEQAAYQEQQQGAKMAQDAGAPAGASFSDLFGNPAAGVTPLGAETTQPDTPVTDGAALGPGAGTEALSSSDTSGDKTRMAAYLPALMYMADNGNSDAARNLVRQIQAQTM